MTDSRQDSWRLQRHEVLASTSDLCRTLAAAGEPEGLAVLADRQTQGRGSRGRGWESPSGNLYLSVLLRPREPAREAGQWSLLAGVALAEALATILPQEAALQLKWPNDVLLAGRKLAGILVDSSADTDGLVEWLVIGLGANLAVAPVVPGRAVACVADLATPPPPAELATVILERLDHWRRVRLRDGFGAVRGAWLALAPRVGAAVTLRVGERLLEGGFGGLAEDGSLLLAHAGRMQAHATGEVLT